jgi:hypothetical protein
MSNLLEKLAQNPKRSMALFLKGVALFAIGALLIILGYFQQYWWQIPGIFFVGLGSLVAIFGYLGIFANRLYTIFNKKR